MRAVAQPAAPVSLAVFREQIVNLKRTVAVCSAAATCAGEGVPGDEDVQAAAGHASFHMSWQWLRATLGAAGKASAQDRMAQMRTAADRLEELETETGVGGEASPTPLARATVDRARSAAGQVLAGDEFQPASGPTWIDKQAAKVQDWFLRLFLGMDRMGARAPWLAPLIEWCCFGLAAGGLLFFVRRSLSRQALRLALGQASPARREGREATDWQRLAEEHAEQREWRAAVHCLYWAAILSLETRRAWRPNPTRTPREYLRLLRPGSEAQSALRTLTSCFERVWYGQTMGTEADFHAAQASFAAIAAADLKRNASAAVVSVETATAGAA